METVHEHRVVSSDGSVTFSRGNNRMGLISKNVLKGMSKRMFRVLLLTLLLYWTFTSNSLIRASLFTALLNHLLGMSKLTRYQTYFHPINQLKNHDRFSDEKVYGSTYTYETLI